MNVLGIESSCDETSVAILSNDVLTANLISSQDFHADFGGVVPELSSRAHLQIVKPLVEQALKKSKMVLRDIGPKLQVRRDRRIQVGCNVKR